MYYSVYFRYFIKMAYIIIITFKFFRTAGLHPFGSAGFLQTLQNHALFVINMPTSGLWQTAGAALPSAYFQKLALMNAQGCQVKVIDKNYLYVAGGYGFDTDYKDMVTFPLVSKGNCSITG